MDKLVRRIDDIVFVEGDPRTISYISPIVSSIHRKYGACCLCYAAYTVVIARNEDRSPFQT
jgi:hypothetical protein